jgi:hypothetical protein
VRRIVSNFEASGLVVVQVAPDTAGKSETYATRSNTREFKIETSIRVPSNDISGVNLCLRKMVKALYNCYGSRGETCCMLKQQMLRSWGEERAPRLSDKVLGKSYPVHR